MYPDWDTENGKGEKARISLLGVPKVPRDVLTLSHPKENKVTKWVALGGEDIPTNRISNPSRCRRRKKARKENSIFKVMRWETRPVLGSTLCDSLPVSIF